MTMTHRNAAVLTISLLLVGTAALAASNEAIKRNNFGAELVKQGRLDEALTEFRSAIQSDAQYTAAHANLAYTYDRLGRVDEAIAAYKNVVALDQKNAIAFNNLGVLYVKKESYDDAIQAFEQGLKADPSNALLQQNLASVKKNRDILKEREVRIADALKKADSAPKEPRAAYDVARVYASFDMQDQAFEWLEKSLRLGLDDIAFVREDPVLLGLRRDPRFARLLEGR
ncbi:MAG: tpr domain protein [candidate division NC10 bacterium]|jgi:tetratricopeptide (TPR) repeat protein|nr:tpr domain protein [candidate division NC10 bacterium]